MKLFTVGDTCRVLGYTMWIAESHYVDVATVPTHGHVRVLLGSYGALESPIPYPQPVTYLHVRLRDSERWTFEPHTGHDVAWLAVSRGHPIVAGAKVGLEMVVFDEGDQPIEVIADGDVDFVIASAVRHPHPLVTGMYSVHTSRKNLMIGENGIEEVASSMALTPWRPLSESLR